MFISQPIATNVEDAAYLIKIAERHPSQVSISGYPHRLDPSFLQLKELIDKGVIGDILSLEMDSNLTQNLSSRYITASGSPFIDYALNEIDLMIWLLGGKPLQLTSMVKDEVILSELDFADAVKCHFKLFQTAEPRYSVLRITGTNGSLEMDNHAQLIKHTHNQGQVVSNVYPKDELNSYHLDYLHVKHFVDVILGKKKNKLQLSANLDALQVAIGLEKSKKLKQQIQID